MTRPQPIAAATLLVLALACGQGDELAKLSPEEAARLDASLASLDDASERVRQEVLRTCDKWKRKDRPCSENLIRREQLECWVESGRMGWATAKRKRLGPYSGDRRAMAAQNICLSNRGWMKIEQSMF
jgi:hypothetical protein